MTSSGLAGAGPEPVDPSWRKNERGRFFRLFTLDAESLGLKDQGGVYVIWHKGIRPQWVYVGAADDLAQALEAAAKDDEISTYEVHGGLHCTWSPIRPEFRAGVVRYLREILKTVVAPRPGDEVDEAKNPPIPVQTPR